MANVAFNKHAEFAELYTQEAHKTLATLFKNGPTREVLGHTAALYTLRQQYAVWLTEKLETDLETFEAALRKIGALSGYVEDTAGTQDLGRPEQIRIMYRTFAEVMGFENWENKPLTKEHALTMMISRLRKILGTEELTAIRATVISRTVSELKNDQRLLTR